MKRLVATLIMFSSLALYASPKFLAAKPVWAAGKAEQFNSQIDFRGVFAWDGAGELKLKFSGCSIFRVKLNGRLVAYGPARGPHGWFRVDERDVKAAAVKGANVLSIEGCGYNIPTYYIVKHPAFLQAEVTSGEKVLWATGIKDEVKAFSSGRVRKTRRYSIQRAFSEAWIVGAPATELKLEEREAVKYLSREVPYPALNYTGFKKAGNFPVTLATGKKSLRDDSALSGNCTFPGKELEYDIDTFKVTYLDERQDAPGKITAARYEGVRNLTGMPVVSVKAHKPCRVTVRFDETLVDGKVSPSRNQGVVNAVTWQLLKPGEYTLEAFEPYTFKWAEVFVDGGEAAAEVRAFGMIEYKNPLAVVGKCRATDPELIEIYEAARETFAQNAVDVLTDCPGRERAGWLCDSYFSGPAEAEFCGGNEVERAYLANFALAEKFEYLPEGMVAMCYPGDHPNRNYIPNWSFWFILELRNYVRRTGDVGTAILLKSRVRALLEFYRKYRNEDGLLENLPAWVFVEWSMANEFVKNCVNYPSNMTYADVLDAAAELYGEKGLAAEAVKVRETIRRQSFDGKWFVDQAKRGADGKLHLQKNDRTETCQYYAFYHRVATPATHPELWKTLTEEFGPDRKKRALYPEIHPSNAFIGNLMRIDLLARENLKAQALKEIKGYYLKMARETGTLWENDTTCASCNHGFAGYVGNLINLCSK